MAASKSLSFLLGGFGGVSTNKAYLTLKAKSKVPTSDNPNGVDPALLEDLDSTLGPNDPGALGYDGEIVANGDHDVEQKGSSVVTEKGTPTFTANELGLNTGMNTIGGAINNLRLINKLSGEDVAGLGLARTANGFALAGMGTDLLGNFLPEKTEYSGEYGEWTQGLDKGYDAASDTLLTSGGPAAIVGGAMKIAGFLGDGANALGLGTDGKTALDAILGSKFFNWNVGLINGAAGKQSDTITRNRFVDDILGSYKGLDRKVSDAIDSLGKYGLFSLGKLGEVNENIAAANFMQNTAEGIANVNRIRLAISSQMSLFNLAKYNMQVNLGYQLRGTSAGKNGMILKDLYRAKRIVSSAKYAKGGRTSDPFEYYLSTLPPNQRNPENYRVRDYWELNGRPKDFEEAKAREMFTLEEDGYWHAHTVLYNEATDEYEFMKSPKHNTIHFEEDWYNSDDPEAVKFRSEWELVKSEPYWKYIRRKLPNEVHSHKQGGSFNLWLTEVDILDIPDEYKTTGLLEISIDDLLPEFKLGGSFNIIPEGALHARKHNMGLDGITTKGIPVVSELEGGELLQQAEIERNEVILRLEVTKKLEELQKKYDSSEYTLALKDEFAIEAGKLLTYELLLNTMDNTGLINEV